MKGLIQWLERRLAFAPTRRITREPGVPYVSSFVTTCDHHDIHFWLLEHPSPRVNVLFFHGNRGNLSTWCSLLELIQARGARLAALDYRGYGRSSGRPSERGLYLDVEAFVDHFWEKLREPGLPVVYWGRSLGGVAAARACQEREPDALILEATFASKQHLVHHLPLLRWMARFSDYEFPTVRFLESRTCPMLVIHASRDKVIPFQAGKELYNLLSPPKEFFQIDGGGHGRVHETQPTRYWKRVSDFLAEISEIGGPDQHRGHRL